MTDARLRATIFGAAITACLTLFSVPASAQKEATADSSQGVTLLLQPGMLSADFLSPPEGSTSTTGFNLRVAALVPSSSRWFTFIVGGSVTPYGTSGISIHNNNTPIFFAGNVFPGFGEGRTKGWLSLQLPLVLTYSYGGGGPHTRSLYGKDIVAEAAFSVHLGRKVLRDLSSPLSRLQVYFIFDQSLTPNEDPASGRTDRFNPVAQYGITLPLGGTRNARHP